MSGHVLPSPYNACGETHSVKELVECAFQFVGLNWQDFVAVDPAFYRPDESVQLVGSIDKIQTQLAWKPHCTRGVGARHCRALTSVPN